MLTPWAPESRAPGGVLVVDLFFLWFLSLMFFWGYERGFYIRLIIHPCMSGTLTMGLTPQAAIAGTASCIAASTNHQYY